MLEKLKEIEEKYNSLTGSLSDIPKSGDRNAYQDIMKSISVLSPVVEKSREYSKILEELKHADEMRSSDDKDMADLANEEYKLLQSKKETVENEIRVLLLPVDPNDGKNILVEIRAGAGGDEAALFTGQLFRLYSRYAENNKWKVEIIESSPTGLGGFKEVIFFIEGKDAYKKLKYESGVHRVQRVPVTEASGRIHTSTASVAVLPEAEEVDVEIKPDDIRLDTYCSSGHGGQGVNTTYSAVRLTHLATGIVVTCQDERSQIKNKAKAMKVLLAKLYDIKIQEQKKHISDERKSQIGSADRSEKIRTYNFPQNRITDHRIGLSVHNLAAVMDGEIEEIIIALISAEHEMLLKKEESNK
jgi:peptide chain release factor 1